jgi:hypothetical protein
MTTDVFIDRRFLPGEPAPAPGLIEDCRSLCLDVLGIAWRESFIGTGHGRMLCRFTAPDLEAARAAWRRTGRSADRLWGGAIQDLRAQDDSAESSPQDRTGVIGEVRCAGGLQANELVRSHGARLAGFATSGVRLTRTIVARDGSRVVWFYDAPDLDSVRAAHRRTLIGVDSVWLYRSVSPQRAGGLSATGMEYHRGGTKNKNRGSLDAPIAGVPAVADDPRADSPRRR